MTVETSSSVRKNTPNGKRERIARLMSAVTSGNWSGPYSIRPKTIRNPRKELAPRPSRSLRTRPTQLLGEREVRSSRFQAPLKSIKHVVPWSRFIRCSAMSSKSLLKELSLPIVQRNLVGVGRDPVPKGLHIVDLLFDRKIVEARGWHGKWLCHSNQYTRTPTRLHSSVGVPACPSYFWGASRQSRSLTPRRQPAV
jgi:hypothetical protein